MPPLDADPERLVASIGGSSLVGSLWLPQRRPMALLVMHPGSGAADRNNGGYFAPIRAALVAAGVAVASYDKRGVGESGGSWLEAGIEEQAGDLLAGLDAAAELVPDAPRGAFGHSEGGWVVLEAARVDALGAMDFAITSSGPAVAAGEAERYAGRLALDRARTTADERARGAGALDSFLALAEAGAPHADLLSLAAQRGDDLALALGGELPDPMLWRHLIRLAAFDPQPALEALRVPLLATFGAEDDLTPTAASVRALHELVDAALLRVEVLPGAGHRMAPPGDSTLVTDYLETIVGFVLAHGR